MFRGDSAFASVSVATSVTVTVAVAGSLPPLSHTPVGGGG